MAQAGHQLQRIGERAFNHRVDTDAEAEYDRLRDLARNEAGKRNSCFDRSRQAYERGDGAEAKALSNEGKKHATQMDAYNKQASEYIFRENNAPGRVADDTIDLHGQFVEEAEDILEMRIKDAQARGQTHLHVIVGKGNHSANHVQKIKPRVEQVCRELGLQYATEANEGRMYVNLQGAPVHGAPPLPAQPGGQYGGYPGSNYPGQQQGGQYGGQPQHGGQQHGGQQHHGGQQQQHGGQQQGGNEIEQVVKKFLPRILKKLCGGSCTVM